MYRWEQQGGFVESLPQRQLRRRRQRSRDTVVEDLSLVGVGGSGLAFTQRLRAEYASHLHDAEAVVTAAESYLEKATATASKLRRLKRMAGLALGAENP